MGPKEGTAVDMWRLIHDTRANTIVMLTNLVENGKVCVEHGNHDFCYNFIYDKLHISSF